LNIGTVGGKALQMMATDGPEVFQGMREALLLGNPDDASLIFSQLAWKALANNVSSGNEFADTLKKVSENAGYVQAGAQAAGAACSFDYKQALENLLGGALTTAFPLSACAMELGTNAIKAGRTAINNTIQQNLYQLWKSYGDDVFDYGVQRGVDSLLGSLARQKFGHNADFEAKYAEHVIEIETELKTTFAQWKAAENAAGPTMSRLQAHKTAYENWGMTSQQRLNERLFDGQGSEVDVFKRYIAMKQMYRARLVGFMPKGTLDTVLDSYAEIAMDAYLDPPAGKTPKAAAQAVIAEQIRKWNPDLFEQEPEVCVLDAAAANSWSNSWNKVLDDYYGDISGTVSLSVSAAGSGADLGEPTVSSSGYGVGVRFVIPKPAAGETHTYTVSGTIAGLSHPKYIVRAQTPTFWSSTQQGNPVSFSVTSEAPYGNQFDFYVWSEFWGTGKDGSFLAAETSVDALKVWFTVE
jgi:hypothetical protein